MNNMSYPVTNGPRVRQEGDVVDLGGTAPGGTVAFEFSRGDAAADPARVVSMQHVGLRDEPPSHGTPVSVHPACREGNDANPRAASGTGLSVDPNASGEPLSPSGMHRGQSPEVLTATRGVVKP
jgi:hypothetical protein